MGTVNGVERARGASSRSTRSGARRRRVGPSHVVAVGGAPARGPVVRPPAVRRRRPEGPGERPLRPVEGPRVAAHVLGPEGRGRDRRRAAAVVPPVRLARCRAIRSRSPTCRGSTSRPVRSARGCPIALGHGARDEDGWHPGARVVPAGGLRGRRGLGVGGDGERLVPRSRQPDRDPRREPARPARPHDARVGPGHLRGPRARVRLASPSRSTATTSRRSTPRSSRPSRPSGPRS